MDSQQASRHVTAEIESVGTLMRSLAGRYEGIFTDLAATLQTALAQSPTMADAARAAGVNSASMKPAISAALPGGTWT